ncbi:MAG: hypothetical protein M3300_07510, partial [Actinomycetota bacterium]|nr:hypothetical protein [Actinomycetota bacterium]
DPLCGLEGHFKVTGSSVEAGQGRGEHPELVGDGSQWSDGVTPGPDPATFMRVHEVVDDRSLLGSFGVGSQQCEPAAGQG